jgi:hypothetical protein
MENVLFVETKFSIQEKFVMDLQQDVMQTAQAMILDSLAQLLIMLSQERTILFVKQLKQSLWFVEMECLNPLKNVMMETIKAMMDAVVIAKLMLITFV